MRGNHRSPVNSPHKWPVTRKIFPFDDVIMQWWFIVNETLNNIFQWNFVRNSKVVIQENAYENVVCKNGGHVVTASLWWNKCCMDVTEPLITLWMQERQRYLQRKHVAYVRIKCLFIMYTTCRGDCLCEKTPETHCNEVICWSVKNVD